MAIIFNEEKKKIDVDLKPPNPGSFAVEGRSMQWQRCREQFANYFKPTCSGLFFAHRRGYENSEKIAAFLGKCEEILELPIKSTYNKCNVNFSTWINLSPFWLDCEIKRSLLTILIRCSQRYDIKEDNFEVALYSVDVGDNDLVRNYSYSTTSAIQRFLFGFTKYSPPDASVRTFPTGWFTIFKDATNEKIIGRLRRPDGSKAESCLVGINSLWA